MSKRNEEVKIIHVFADGTESDTLEGHGPDAEQSLAIYNIWLAARARKAAELARQQAK